MTSSVGSGDTLIGRIALRTCAWCERWVPDAYAVVVLVVAIVAVGALALGAEPVAVAKTFGDGFWSLIPFTMQMTFIIVGGYVTADSPPVARLIQRVAAIPKTGRGAIVLVAVSSMLLALIHWGLCLVVASLLARTMARRSDLNMDYRAAGAAAYLGNGSVWALGLSSSAAQLQANPASMPPSMLAITGVIPFSETIFLWQSMLLAAVIIVVSTWTTWATAPDAANTRTAQQLGIDVSQQQRPALKRTRPGEWLEFSPLLTIFVLVMAVIWLVEQISRNGLMLTISSLNNYNFIFLMTGLALHWRPRRFLDSAARSMSSVAGVLIQFPMLGAISMMMTAARNDEGQTVATVLARVFSEFAAGPAFSFVVGIYSAVLGLLVPSGGGKWLIEAPYVMQAAVEMEYHLGWVVQIYNASEALPNLINPFWMLPVLGILGLKARELIGFTSIQLMVNLPLVLVLLWLLGMTLTYSPPVMP
jgi:short-chain fatty acids transporter